MTKLINLRGTHGSGKSYVMRNFLGMHKHRPLHGMLGPRHPEAYEMTVTGTKWPVYVIGPYLTACGGLDAVQPYENILVLLDKYIERGHLVFEGLMASGVYGRIGEWMEPYGKDVYNLFLDTPYETCLKRVKDRRLERGNRTELDPTNVKKKYAAVGYVWNRLEREGLFNFEKVSSTKAAMRMTQILQRKRKS